MSVPEVVVARGVRSPSGQVHATRNGYTACGMTVLDQWTSAGVDEVDCPHCEWAIGYVLRHQDEGRFPLFLPSLEQQETLE